MEVRAHCATDDFGVPHVNRPGKGHCGRGAQRRGGPNDGPDIPRILDRVKHDEPERPGRIEGIQRSQGCARYRQDTLWRVGFGGAAELLFVDLGDLDVPGPCRLDQRGTARRVDQLGRDEEAGGGQRRSQQFLHRANPLDDEPALAVAGFSTLEIPG